MNQCKYLIEYSDITVHDKHNRIEFEKGIVFTLYKWASKSSVGPVEFSLHWSGMPGRLKMLISIPDCVRLHV